MGWLHLVGEAPAGLSTKRQKGLRDLAIAIAIGALIWIGDVASGGHLAGAVNTFAARLAAWFEERREPVFTCEPGRPRPYAALEGVILQVPECWEVEVVPLLGSEVHRFHDPEARLGTLSVSVQPIEGDEDRRELEAEFDKVASLRGARVDGALRPGGSSGPDHAQAGRAPEETPGGARAGEPGSPDAGEEGEVTGSPAERLLHGARAQDQASSASGASGASGPDVSGPSVAPSVFRRVEAGGMMGPALEATKSARQSDGTYSKRTWNWLLLGDREAVRIVYTVRADWSESAIVAAEFKRASALADSVRPSDR